MKSEVTTELYAPPGYDELSAESKGMVCNGCGPKGLGSWIIPDTLWGLSIEECCNIHDYMYKVGESDNDKREADRVFLNNMLRVVDSGHPLLKFMRKRRAWKYYEAVSHFGGPAFWSGKNK